MSLPPDDRGSVPPPPSAPPPPQAPPGGATAYAAPPTWQQSSVGHAALGSRAARFGASILDSIIVFVPIVIIAAAAGDNSALSGLVVLLYLAGIGLYAPLLMMRQGPNNGQTLGKQVVGLRVVQASGEPMTIGAGLLREAVGKALISAITCGIYGLLDSLWCLWDPKKQCLHDKIASTYVLDAGADPRVATTLA
ncbi:MAG: domain containing protein [Conexibacter sp.]|nr:domain containing protein [Conexibacter sp.]